MTRIKDKLAESVRQAKSAKSAGSSGTTAENATAKPQSGVSAGAARKRRPPRDEAASRNAVPARSSSDDASRAEPAASAHLLFPERIWPD